MNSDQKASIRQRLWKAQKGKCFYCERRTVIRKIISGERQPNNLATLDHVVPLSRDGAFAPTRNCVVACRACNHARGNMAQDEFLRTGGANRG